MQDLEPNRCEFHLVWTATAMVMMAANMQAEVQLQVQVQVQVQTQELQLVVVVGKEAGGRSRPADLRSLRNELDIIPYHCGAFVYCGGLLPGGRGGCRNSL